MNVQPSLFAEPIAPPREGYRRFEILVSGVPMLADFNPSWMGTYPFPVVHIEFHSREERVPNPLSETGYLSQFVFAFGRRAV